MEKENKYRIGGRRNSGRGRGGRGGENRVKLVSTKYQGRRHFLLIFDMESKRKISGVEDKNATVESGSSTPVTKKAKKTTKSTLSSSIIPSNILSSVAPQNKWVDLNVSAIELRPSYTLVSGQTFAWREVSCNGECDVECVQLEPQTPGIIQSPQKEEKIRGEKMDTPTKSPTKNTAWGSVTGKEWVGVLEKQ